MQVVYCTTPANVFHVLRRQIHRESANRSSFSFQSRCCVILLHARNWQISRVMIHFHRVLGDTAHEMDDFKIKPKEEIKRLILCSGQVWAAIHRERANQKIDGIPLPRRICAC